MDHVAHGTAGRGRGRQPGDGRGRAPRCSAQGGSAADAAVAMVLTSCVAETVFTGLAGGGFATYYDAGSGDAACLDFFVAVPGLAGRARRRRKRSRSTSAASWCRTPSGPRRSPCPGSPPVWRRCTSAGDGSPGTTSCARARPRANAGSPSRRCSRRCCHRRGGDAARRRGRVYADATDAIAAGRRRSSIPGWTTPCALLRTKARRPSTPGGSPKRWWPPSVSRGPGAVDLPAYQVQESSRGTPRRVDVLARGNDLDDLLGTLAGLDLTTTPRDGRAWSRRCAAVPRRGDTTSVAAADGDGNACAVTTSLGLSSGVWLADYGMHLNSMMGEGELLRGDSCRGSGWAR